MNDSLLNQIVNQNTQMSEKIGVLTGKVDTHITSSNAIAKQCRENTSNITGLQQQADTQRGTIADHSKKFAKLDDIKVRIGIRVVLILLGVGGTGTGLMYVAKFMDLLK